MIVTLDNGRRFDSADPIDISIPLRFNGPQPNAYGVEPASAKACEYGTLVGDTRRGGSCNFETYTFIPHCNGTHSECVGHITNERISVRDCLQDTLIEAFLITVQPVDPVKTDENYSTRFGSDDKLITESILREALRSLKASDFALIIRTLPNDDTKLSRLYDASNIPPYLTTEAMKYIVECGCKHLLVDLPSIDRLFDEGRLSNHRIFWNVEEASFDIRQETRTGNTVTELIYVPESVADGEYLLNLQIAPFAADAAPSRPLLFRLLQR